jgi:hypothetical protein
MEPHDRPAMQAAIEELLRLEPTWNETVAGMLETQPFEAVGAWAATICQVRNMRLKSWECPPADSTNVREPCDRYGSRPDEVELLRRLLRAGVSRYHPDPMQALAAAKAKQPAA